VKTYLINLKLWALGFGRADEIKFKPGWSASDKRWLALYLLDYGTHVLTGAAVVSWSRWFYDNKATNRFAAFMNRLLNHLDAQHGAMAGPALWGTKDCTRRVRIVVTAVLLGLILFPVVSRAAIQPEQLGIVINTDDPASELMAFYYRSRHGIGSGNVVRVSLGSQEAVSRGVFEQAALTVKAELSSDIQALALMWRLPARVGAYNSITSAFARGYYERPAGSNGYHAGYDNPYGADQNHSQPFTRHGIRPAMMVTGSGRWSSLKLIVRGSNANGTAPQADALLMSTPDMLRSWRARSVPASQVINGITLRVVRADTAGSNPVMFYFQGAAVIPDLLALDYLPGAWVDTLTSCSGMVGGCGGQTTVWQIIDAGATGSYGTVEEPYALPNKFPNPATFVRIYTGGSTLIEAAWRSVGNPYQGLFVGDPLASPWGDL